MCASSCFRQGHRLNRVRSGERHPVHHKDHAGAQLSNEQIQYLRQNPDQIPSQMDPWPLDLDGPLIQVDTTDFDRVDYGGVLRQIHALLEP
jgi:hypothetical protein